MCVARCVFICVVWRARVRVFVCSWACRKNHNQLQQQSHHPLPGAGGIAYGARSRGDWVRKCAPGARPFRWRGGRCRGLRDLKDVDPVEVVAAHASHGIAPVSLHQVDPTLWAALDVCQLDTLQAVPMWNEEKEEKPENDEERGGKKGMTWYWAQVCPGWPSCFLHPKQCVLPQQSDFTSGRWTLSNSWRVAIRSGSSLQRGNIMANI